MNSLLTAHGLGSEHFSPGRGSGLGMYQENILDHARHPRNFGQLDQPAQHTHLANPLCGDEIDFFLNYDDHQKVSAVKFTGRGCTVSMAAASMLSERLVGMSMDEINNLTAADIEKILGVPITPARLKCATLGLESIQSKTKI